MRIVRTWAGMEDKEEDHLPVIGAWPNASAACYALGFSGQGFQLVPVASAMVANAILADLVVRGDTNRLIGALSAARPMDQHAMA